MVFSSVFLLPAQTTPPLRTPRFRHRYTSPFAERFHISRLEQLCPGANYALINDFNPAMPKGQDLDDPWYGPDSGFRSTLADIEAAMPGIFDALA